MRVAMPCGWRRAVASSATQTGASDLPAASAAGAGDQCSTSARGPADGWKRPHLSVDVFSIPMMVDRRVDAVTSINAVLSGSLAMVSRLPLNVIEVVLGFATLFIGLAVILLVIVHVAGRVASSNRRERFPRSE